MQLKDGKGFQAGPFPIMPIPQLAATRYDTYDPNEKPPPFGHSLKPYFPYDDDFVNLNHGSYGSLPLPVIHAATKLAYEIERNPDDFYRLESRALLTKSRAAVAKLIGAKTDEVVLVPNASHAYNVVLRNFEWREGDVIITASTTYDCMAQTARYLASRSEPPRPSLFNIDYKFPLTHAQILDIFRSKLRECKEMHAGTQFTDVPQLSPGYTEDVSAKKNKIIVVIDGITANPGALMPWQEMVRIAREEGVWSVVDAAHCIGQEPNINLSEAKPDFWLSNCHKWLYAKRGCAGLYVPKRNQHIIKSAIPVIHFGVDFVKQHELNGTVDLVPYILIPQCIAFREWLGGEQVMHEYCHQLALDGAKRLAEILGTRVLDDTGELTVHMSNVQLPLPVEKTTGEVYSPEMIKAINALLQLKLLREWKTYATHFFHNGAWWCRCSAQVFNELPDFEYLARALIAVCKEVETTILSKDVA
ncbi:PLP-dependent transferase [Earliella scabrosa]|nr:PLP-dependent transferase [Earliella scabrosa]